MEHEYIRGPMALTIGRNDRLHVAGKAPEATAVLTTCPQQAEEMADSTLTPCQINEKSATFQMNSGIW